MPFFASEVLGSLDGVDAGVKLSGRGIFLDKMKRRLPYSISSTRTLSLATRTLSFDLSVSCTLEP